MAGVLIEKLSKTFGEPKQRKMSALQEVSLEVSEGELLAVLGPSGSGKTTLLRIIAGLEQPSSGTVSIGGRIVNQVPSEERDVAMVFQDHALYPHMTVCQNLAFGMKLRKFDHAETEHRVREAADMLGLAPLLERLPNALSGGERQRVALGRAMVLKPRLLLLDEPLSNLDAPLRAQMRREIVRLQHRLGVTMLYVTHDQSEAMSLASRMALIEHGVLRQVGPPMEIYDQPANLFAAGFIGSPRINLVAGRLLPKGGSTWFQAEGPPQADNLQFKLEETLAASLSNHAGKDLVLGIRPEHIQLIKNSPALPGPALQATIEAVESLGPETHVYLKVGACPLTARLAGGSDAKAGDAIGIALSLNKAHFFDAKLGHALT